MSREEHEGIVRVISGILKTQKIKHKVNKEYAFGEFDVLCNNIYYEVKGRFSVQNMNKAQNQISRAMRYKQCYSGYLVTPMGVYDVFRGEWI